MGGYKTSLHLNFERLGFKLPGRFCHYATDFSLLTFSEGILVLL